MRRNASSAKTKASREWSSSATPGCRRQLRIVSRISESYLAMRSVRTTAPSRCDGDQISFQASIEPLLFRPVSIVIAMHFGDYALLCADTRTIYVMGDKRVHVDDDKAKVHKWAHGLITGSGLTNLLDPVIDRVLEEAPLRTEEMGAIIDDEREMLRDALEERFDTEEVEGWFYSTGWFVTYTTLVDGAPKVRIQVHHPSFEAADDNGGALRMADQTVIVLVPATMGPEKQQEYSDRAVRLLRPLSDFESAQDHYQYHVMVCASLVASVAKETDSVSSKMLVGVHLLADVQLSDVMDAKAIAATMQAVLEEPGITDAPGGAAGDDDPSETDGGSDKDL